TGRSEQGERLHELVVLRERKSGPFPGPRAERVVEYVADVHRPVPPRVLPGAVAGEAPVLVELPQRVVAVELLDGEQLAAPAVGEEELDVVEVHADRRRVDLGRPEQRPQGAAGAAVQVDVDGDEAQRRV